MKVQGLQLSPAIAKPVLGALLVLLSCFFPGQSSAQDMIFHRIGTGAVGDTYFAIGGMIANSISNPPGARPCDKGGTCGVPGLIAIAQSTEGSVQNVEALVSGMVESALVQADVVYWAHHGTGQFNDREAMSSLRAIANLFPSTLHIVVRRNSGVSDVAELRGRRVSLGEQGSGTLVTARAILSSYGIAEEDVTAVYDAPGAAAHKLAEGEIDAFFLVGGVPVRTITELAGRVPLALLPIDGQTGEEIRSFFPFFTDAFIAPSAYLGVGRTHTVGISTQWVTTEDAPEELIHDVTAALWHERSRNLFENGHPEGRRMNLENALSRVAIPLHEGSARFYREQNIER